MSVILPHVAYGLNANLRCRSETCYARLAENTGRKKVTKNRHLGTIVQLYWAISLSGYIFATKADIDNWKKLVKQQYLLHMSPQYGEIWPTNG